ncbi:ATP-binding cassette domain-containing protein [Micromonospora cabrerizensis]|uniref:ATP-binding cassette domain-containing protein n=1 Tax=Micromonospora cabrerizensis TaxID=2911213 RepID=UPI003557D533
MVAIDARELRQGYGSRRVIEGLDLQFGKGVLGLLGPNGAGKTTLLRTLATVVPAQSGQLRILGSPVDSVADARRVRRDIGYLPQDFGYFGSFTVREFVRYAAWLRELPTADTAAAVDDALAMVDLSDRATTRLKALSGGMLRRCGIASAIVGTPKLVILDEPTVGLDPLQRMEFRLLIRRLAATCAVVVSTHLVEDVGMMCTEVAVMVQGRITFLDTPDMLAAGAADDAIGDSPLERGYTTLLAASGERSDK